MEFDLEKVLNNLSNRSLQELCEMHHVFNWWGWDDRAGERPEGFDDLPDYNWRWIHRLFRRKTKDIYITPIVRQIKRLVPSKELYRYHHIHILKYSEAEFEKWWSVHGDDETMGTI